MWGYLPDVILEEVFLLLDMKQRHACSLVCRHWSVVFNASRIWRRLVIDERSFTKRKYTVFLGFRNEICLRQLQLYLSHVGHHTQYIEFKPTTNFYNLYEIMRVISTFLEFFEDYSMPNLRKFRFTFECESRSRNEIDVHGTGGQVLSGIQRLLNDLQDVTDITVNNLLLEDSDAVGLLTDIVTKHSTSLLRLEILNVSKNPRCLYAIGQLTSLQCLAVTQSHLPPEALLTICTGIPTLEELVLVDDRFTVRRRSSVDEYAIFSSVWFAVRQFNVHLRVRLEFRRHDNDVLTYDGVKTIENDVLPDGAPVHAVIYTSSLSRVTSQYISRLTEFYADTLVTYAHVGLGRGYRSRRFCERADALLVQLVRSCTHLQTLVIRERVSTATLLIIAREGLSLKRLCVRRNAVLLRRDWDRDAAWSDEYWNWLWSNARSYEAVEKEIWKCLRAEKRWKLMSDAEFKSISV